MGYLMHPGRASGSQGRWCTLAVPSAMPTSAPAGFDAPFPTALDWEWPQGWLSVNFKEARPTSHAPGCPQDGLQDRR